MKKKDKEYSTRRNWTKARLTGFKLDRDVLTITETKTVDKIDSLISELLEHWDEGSRELGIELKRFNVTVYTLAGQQTIFNLNPAQLADFKKRFGKENCKVDKL